MQTETEESQLLSLVYSEIQERFKHFDDPAHGWEHIRRVYELAMYIAKQENADAFITGMAALLHDVGRLAHEEGQHHADLSASEASKLLGRYQAPSAAQEAIVHAIVTHSFSRGIEPRTLEARIVRDADRLDSLGAIGILRWAITGTVRRTPQTLTYHPDDPFAEKHTPDDHHYMLDHFFTKLLKLGDSMSTTTGRRLATRRIAFMRAYLDEFKNELTL
ncbi:MAG TPA: HD domain-containing protein [Ktedonobacteraceae bacterium]|nr:HD domain-containing protein [Ktedonobacteraceae bacterium]